MNKTPSNPSDGFARGTSAQPREEFGSPSVTSLAGLEDGRELGDFSSRYSRTAWSQIIGELAYLLVILTGSVTALVLLAIEVVQGAPTTFYHTALIRTPLVVWLAAGLAGACGGSCFALKWLYHGVAKQRWHRDRVVWRIVVPPLSAVLSVFTGLMIVSGLIPFFSHTPFDSPLAGAAFGFFIGLFSDNLLAALQKLAHRIFGTIDTTGK